MIDSSNASFISLGREAYLRWGTWKDRQNGFLLWPALWGKRHVKAGLHIICHRLTFGWGTLRCQVDWVKLNVPSDLARQPLNMEEMGIDDMLNWAKVTFGRAWTRLDFQRLLQRKPEWGRLMLYSTPEHYYTRVLLARELIADHEAAILASQGGALDTQQDDESVSGAVGTGSKKETSPLKPKALDTMDSISEEASSVMDGLTELEYQLKKD